MGLGHYKNHTQTKMCNEEEEGRERGKSREGGVVEERWCGMKDEGENSWEGGRKKERERERDSGGCYILGEGRVLYIRGKLMGQAHLPIDPTQAQGKMVQTDKTNTHQDV